jgi:hypothetical protein
MRYRKLISLAALLCVAGTALAQNVHVRGYTRRDGSYVAPHMRSAPNSTTQDNWTTRGNVNPYTGVEGTRSPELVAHPRSYRPNGGYERQPAPCYYNCPK